MAKKNLPKILAMVKPGELPLRYSRIRRAVKRVTRLADASMWGLDWRSTTA